MVIKDEAGSVTWGGPVARAAEGSLGPSLLDFKIYFLSMLSATTQALLTRFFVEIAQSERSIEIQRQIVCEDPDFEPRTAFARIASARGAISPLDLTLFLR